MRSGRQKLEKITDNWVKTLWDEQQLNPRIQNNQKILNKLSQNCEKQH